MEYNLSLLLGGTDTRLQPPQSFALFAKPLLMGGVDDFLKQLSVPSYTAFCKHEFFKVLQNYAEN